ncbi:acyl-CoA/acyl-ACP dehydrogenase [Alicyclobacillus tolerans]|uniref:acyl-CoA dehydrogenase family protein n=1 Tax=Alicyclobacillus tolerans TaxID=90970 RepID=UPI001F1CE7AB|nr:acyl-CoA dehydrogenase family protein [Alicyclobacillus tolerans]MCF8565541.1 acyl-CoA/acyl-ACP dehydrogenase [Alicyclobacillus tolerans]
MTFSGFELTREMKMLQETILEFIDEEVVPVETALPGDAREIPEDELMKLQRKAKAAGLWNLPVPAEFGGGGLDTFEMVIAAEAGSQNRFGMPELAGGAFGHQVPVVLYNARPEQIQTYLIPSVENGWRWFTAITEPSGGSDPARSIRTKAERVGDEWVLNGTKLFSTGADESEYGVVYARTGEGRNGISAFVVPANTPGMSVRPVPVLRDHWTTEIHFEDCRIPYENLLGEVGQGFQLAQKWLVRGRVVMAAQVVGIAQRALQMAIEYSKLRSTFGAQLSSRQSIQWMIADSAVDIQAARWLTWEAAYKDVQGQDARYEASVAKLFATEKAFTVLDRVMQIHGGMGVAKEYNIEHWFRSLRVSRIVEGPSEVHRHLISRDLLSDRRKLQS